jgi:hypothetical protein
MKKTRIALTTSLLLAFPALAQDVGVAECDAYLKHYAQCIEKGAGADTKKMMLDAVAESRKMFIDLKTQAAPEALQKICKETQAAMKDTFEALKCKPM